MLISSKGTYAIRVLIDMATNNGNEKIISISEISNRLNISRKYLESIMTLLSKNGIIDVAYGKNGGYRLNRLPEEYNLLVILHTTEDDLAPVLCQKKDYEPCTNKENCSVHKTCEELHDLINNFLLHKTIKDLMENTCK
ncbi:MAG: Rrf2 family transcriptional regulator [Erysipelotrichaceae bacterium]|nr:Rrf2 family transcriptional regulator [Erysipelotrichaceae bacterium]